MGSAITVSMPSDEQSDALMSGTKAPEEVKQELGVSGGLNQPADNLAQETVTKEILVNQCVAELSACKVDVMADLGKLKSEALAQWTALPEEERNSGKKMQLGVAALRQCYDYEVEVDAAVQVCLERYRTELETIRADTASSDTMEIMQRNSNMAGNIAVGPVTVVDAKKDVAVVTASVDCPRAIKRCEFAAICSRFAQAATGGPTFTDVPASHWAYKNINTCAAYGWINGVGDGTFQPDRTISRAETATMVNRMLGRLGAQTAIDAGLGRKFPDVTTAHWAWYQIGEATAGHNYTVNSDRTQETWK